MAKEMHTKKKALYRAEEKKMKNNKKKTLLEYQNKNYKTVKL